MTPTRTQPFQPAAQPLRLLLAGLLIAGAAGCDDDPDATPDTGAPDAASMDMSGADMAEVDMAEVDMGQDMAEADMEPPACQTPTEGEPIAATAGEWSWIPVDGMRCANGDPTGIAVNLAPGGADRVLIYLLGGGGCWDAASCYELGLANHITDGFDAEKFAATSLEPFPYLDRERADNPFDDYHLVFVPYCTGALHAGDEFFCNLACIKSRKTIFRQRGYRIS